MKVYSIHVHVHVHVYVNFEIKFAENIRGKKIALFLAVIMNTIIHTLPEGDTYLGYEMGWDS